MAQTQRTQQKIYPLPLLKKKTKTSIKKTTKTNIKIREINPGTPKSLKIWVLAIPAECVVVVVELVVVAVVVVAAAVAVVVVVVLAAGGDAGVADELATRNKIIN